ncbi:MAG: DUF4908 domain-containing protein [Pseudomonadota bacterium]
MLVLILLIAGGLAIPAGAGFAQSSNPFARLLGEDRSARAERVATWYVRADGAGRFIFDRTVEPALIWREGDPEVIAVERSSASGGGEVWVGDTGRTWLRFSNLGGATYFPEDAPDGVIVDPVGRAQTLVPPPLTNTQLQAAAREMVDALAELTRSEVTAQITPLSASENAYIADTMTMVVIGSRAAGRREVRELQAVRIGFGEAPQVVFTRGALDITVAPALGYGGRPSSDAIRRAFSTGR